MSAFFATIQTSFRRQLTYRAANLSGLAINLMFGFFRASVPSPLLLGAEITHREGSTVVYSFERQKASASKLINKLSENYRITDLEVRDQPIEDTIREIYENHLLYNHPYDKKNPSP